MTHFLSFSWMVEDAIWYPNKYSYRKSVNSRFSIDDIRDEEFAFKTPEGSQSFFRPDKNFQYLTSGLKSATMEIRHKKNEPDVYLRFQSFQTGRGSYHWGEYKTLHLEVLLKSSMPSDPFQDGSEESGKAEGVWQLVKAFAIPLESSNEITDDPCQQRGLYLKAELCPVDILKDYMIHDPHHRALQFFRLGLPIRVSVMLSKDINVIPDGPRQRTWGTNSTNLMKKLLSESLFSDFTIHVGESTFPCHRNILAGLSEVFAKMFDTKMSEMPSQMVEMEDMSPAGVAAFLKYLYYKDVDDATWNSAIGFELLQAGHKYQIKELELESLHILSSMAAKKFDAKTAFGLFEFGGLVEGFKDLETKAACVFKENAVTYGETGEFAQVLGYAKPQIVAKLFEVMALL